MQYPVSTYAGIIASKCRFQRYWYLQLYYELCAINRTKNDEAHKTVKNWVLFEIDNNALTTGYAISWFQFYFF